VSCNENGKGLVRAFRRAIIASQYISGLLRRKIKSSRAFELYESLNAVRFLLTGRRKCSFTRAGEDVFLAEYFGDYTGVYLDIGANHPFLMSNTFLLYQRRWRGITVEPLPRLAAKHRFWRPGDLCLNMGIADRAGRMTLFEFSPHTLSTFDEIQAKHLVDNGCVLVRAFQVEVETLANLWPRYRGEYPQVDLMCVDTEGMDIRVLKGNNFDLLRPRLIVCEAFGDASVSAEMENYLKTKRYRKIRVFTDNMIFECEE
jgi:FkbM family methyltransferase